MNYISTISKKINNQNNNSWFLMPNQNLEWINWLVKEESKDTLFAGGVLYAGIYKALKPETNTIAIEINPLTALMQLYTIYVMNEHPNDILSYLPLYARIKPEFNECFNEFLIINGCDSLDVKGVKIRTPLIALSAINNKIRPLMPDNVIISNLFEHEGNYDLISTNNIFEWFGKLEKSINVTKGLIKNNGLIELTFFSDHKLESFNELFDKKYYVSYKIRK